MIKNILCYGDSMTWGYNPEAPPRFAFSDRWPNVMAAALGPNFIVQCDGLAGRTTTFDDFTGGTDRNGARTLPNSLDANCPLDLVIIFLGINDLKSYVCGKAIIAAQGVQRLVHIVRHHQYLAGSPPQVLLVAPAPLCSTNNTHFAEIMAGAQPESEALPAHIQAVATGTGCHFFAAGSVASASPLDGLHIGSVGTRALGLGLAGVVSGIFPRS